MNITKTTTLILLSLFSFFATSQELKPTETKALLNFMVTDMDGFPKNNETVIVKNIVDGIEYSAITKEDGKCGILVPKGKKYKVKYVDLTEKTDYSDFDVPNKFGLMSFNIQIKFEPSKMIEVKGIEFEKGTSTLTYNAKLNLDTVAKYLNTKKIKIEIACHSDNSLSAKESLDLTQKQADAIKGYLISKDVKADNLTAKAYGSSEQITDNITEENRKKNNRVEFRIKKLYF
jgi:outer membrane protein OmpA-like peptidoglycan-associated protein